MDIVQNCCCYKSDNYFIYFYKLQYYHTFGLKHFIVWLLPLYTNIMLIPILHYILVNRLHTILRLGLDSSYWPPLL
jgi:hypothetical protein